MKLKDKFYNHLKSTILSKGKAEITIRTVARRMAEEAAEHYADILIKCFNAD